MKGGDTCPKCAKEEVILVDPTETEWGLDADDYDEGADVWVCNDPFCDWSEEATPEESLEEATAQLEWAIKMVERIQEKK